MMNKDLIETSFRSYCAECNRDYAKNEIVYYTWYENSTFCSDCRDVMNTKVSESYLDWQLRVNR